MRPALTPERIARAAQAAGRAFEISPHAIIGRRRLPAIVRARLALYAALYRVCETSYPQLGRLLNRDHSTILYGVREAERDAATDPDFAAALACVMEACRA
jgi:chromosomal replication initiation ATPase DnaA